MPIYNKKWIDNYITRQIVLHHNISKLDVKRIIRLFSTSELRRYFIAQCKKLNSRRGIEMEYSKMEIIELLKLDTIQPVAEIPQNTKPQESPGPGMEWIKVHRGGNNFMWVKRKITDPDYISSTESAQRERSECTIRDVIVKDDDLERYFQSTFEGNMRRYASGGLNRYHKGNNVYSEWFGKKKKR